MLGAHSAIHAPDEPHMMTPLAHLGYFDAVERAPYDPIITREGQRALVAQLPEGEADYLDALRACSDTIYERLLGGSGARLLLDKTPAYALVLDFIAKLYPQAHFVVTTRHPLAVWTSQVDSFFDGDFEAAERNNPILERYVPAIARFLRERPVPLVHVRYEELVADPETGLRAICEHLGVEFEPGMVEYGATQSGAKKAADGLGDPSVSRETRPTTANVGRWAGELAARPAMLAHAQARLGHVTDQDLETWGYSRSAILQELDAATPAANRRRRPLDRFALQRRLLVRVRRNIHHNALGRTVRKVREVCDVLLR
jgi:hypothetical protein